MAKCRIIFVRHGQSEGNLVRSFLGHTDLPLTELGHKQAEATAEYLKDTDIDIIYASDLKRAWQTAEHIAEKKELEERLDKVFITVNKNAIPADPEKPSITSGIRVGTPAVTSRGFGIDEMTTIAECITMAADNFDANADAIRAKVKGMCDAHPVYNK